MGLIKNLANFVTLSTSQAITGIKTFSTGALKALDITSSADLTIKTEALKTAVFEQSVFKDINFGAAQLSKPASSAPTLDEFKDNTGTDTGISTLSFSVGDRVSSQFELQHDYKEGTALSPHVHYQIIDAPSGTDKIKWQLIYTISMDGATLAPITTIVIEQDVDTQYTEHRADFPDIDGTNLKVGSQFLFQLSRIAASADEFSGGALIITAGTHYEIDTLGSRQKLIK